MEDLALVTGPLHLAALVLAVSGAHKLLEPEAAGRAMRTAGVPGPLASGRVVGVAELVAGAGVLAFGGPVAVGALGLLYAAFACFLLVLRRRDAAAPCGCFGASDAPPGGIHLVLNVASAAVAVAALATASPHLVDVVEAADAPSTFAYALLLLVGTVGIFTGTTVVEQIRRTTDLMRA